MINTPPLTLRGYQQEAQDSLMFYLSNYSGNPLIVMPTASGKSLVMASIFKHILTKWPYVRILMLTHVKELIEQNYVEFTEYWPEASAGIYSAGLKRRDLNDSVIFGGIQSIRNKAFKFQFPRPFDLIFIDECHLVSQNNNTSYRKFIDDCLTINENVKVVGLTATQYRLDSGLLTTGDNKLFDDIAYEVSVKRLIDEGFLAPLVGKRTSLQYDMAAVHTRGGEFIPKELNLAVNQDELTQAAVKEIIQFGADRRSWLIFCSGISHAESVAEELRFRGVVAECISNNTSKTDRARMINDFKSFKIQALTNCDILTTGFNARGIDMLAMLRPTQSTALYVQICGRGMRTFDGKKDCLILDFAKNIERHGPIDLIDVKDKKMSAGDGEAPVKACPECGSYVHLSLLECPDCGYLFPPPKPKHEKTASETSPMSELATTRWFNVVDVTYVRHQKEGKPDSFKVTYYCVDNFDDYDEQYTVPEEFHDWQHIERTGWLRFKADQFMRERGVANPQAISTVTDLLKISHELMIPSRIGVIREGRWDRVFGAVDFKKPPAKLMEYGPCEGTPGYDDSDLPF